MEDVDSYKLFSNLWQQGHKDWKISAENRGKGTFHDWAYFHGGRWSIATNGWNFKQIALEETIKVDDKDKSKKKVQDTIVYFNQSKNYKWLTNFNAANPFTFKDREYVTMEHAYQAQQVESAASHQTCLTRFSDIKFFLKAKNKASTYVAGARFRCDAGLY